mmetsp:Transcript_36895/g.40757  ORF Transcript_36895/g.40757 Transcript_36895/m.40757 type:complete len:91 (+) Transcript_36895:577-849(+)
MHPCTKNKERKKRIHPHLCFLDRSFNELHRGSPGKIKFLERGAELIKRKLPGQMRSMHGQCNVPKGRSVRTHHSRSNIRHSPLRYPQRRR